MGQPFNATWRVAMPYTTALRNHVMHVFASSTDVAPPYSLNDRAAGVRLFSLCAQGLWDSIRKVMSNHATTFVGTIRLEQRTGSLWLPVEFYTPTGAGSQGNAENLATEVTIVLRNLLNDKVKVAILEGAPGGTPQHWLLPNTAGDPSQVVAAEFSELHTVTNAPYFWAKSRSNNFLALVPTVGITLTYNRKMRRARGMT